MRRTGAPAAVVVAVASIASLAACSAAADVAPQVAVAAPAKHAVVAAPGRALQVEPDPVSGRRVSQLMAAQRMAVRRMASSRRTATKLSRAWLSIPALGIKRLPVEAYRGTADDAPGTRIQNRGIAASPRGPRGGGGPGEIGNLIITAHRTTHGAPLRRLPSLTHGGHVLVAADGMVYDYVVTRTMTISFRSARSRASQSAPVPGRLGKRATEASITLSTCRTPEDRAEGNYWSDALGNPEHRIVKVGVLAAVRPDRSAAR